jgi:hypothetical protein
MIPVTVHEEPVEFQNIVLGDQTNVVSKESLAVGTRSVHRVECAVGLFCTTAT